MELLYPKMYHLPDGVYFSQVYFAITYKWISILAFSIMSLPPPKFCFILLYRKFCATKVLVENGLSGATKDKLPLPGQSHRVCSQYDKIFVAVSSSNLKARPTYV
jgi:hypothetical protein